MYRRMFCVDCCFFCFSKSQINISEQEPVNFTDELSIEVGIQTIVSRTSLGLVDPQWQTAFSDPLPACLGKTAVEVLPDLAVKMEYCHNRAKVGRSLLVFLSLREETEERFRQGFVLKSLFFLCFEYVQKG